MLAPNVYGKPFCVLNDQSRNLMTKPRTVTFLVYVTAKGRYKYKEQILTY